MPLENKKLKGIKYVGFRSSTQPTFNVYNLLSFNNQYCFPKLTE